LIKNISRETPGLVPVTLTEALTVVSALIELPEVGVVKHTVTVYAPEEGVLDAQVLFGGGVAVGVAVGVTERVGVAVGVGVGVRLGRE
jgi:hypothetical protein